MSRTIHLGYEVGTGNQVEIPLLNTAITGMTQESGKTTTLEAMAHRAGVATVAFVTKRGERAFENGHRIQPYFRDRADWQFVDQLLSAQLGEKNKWLRQWFIPICRTARTLADVHRAIRESMAKAKGTKEGALIQLDAYLELIVPEIESVRLGPAPVITGGLNVVDVSSFSTPMQMLFVQSMIDWINTRERNVVTIIPEAWEFIPEGKGSPVKSSAESLVRKGSGIGNYIWPDSQDMAGVDKMILRGCSVWIIGVQREANEIKRNLSNIPAGIKRPKPEEIAALRRGQFFACWKDRVVKVYVQPAWSDPIRARAAALAGQQVYKEPIAIAPSDKELEYHDGFRQEVTEVDNATATRIENENAELKRKIEKLEDQIRELNKGRITPPNSTVLEMHSPSSTRGDASTVTMASALKRVLTEDEEMLYQRFKQRLIQDSPALLKVIANVHEIEVIKVRQTLSQDLDTPLGRVGYLIAHKFFDQSKSIAQAFKELQRLGNAGANPRFYEAVAKAHSMGFLTKEDDGFRAVPGMKVRITEAA